MSQNQEKNKEDFFDIYTESERPTLGLVDYLMVTLVPISFVIAYVVFMKDGVRDINHYISNATFVVGVVYTGIGAFAVLSYYGNYDALSYGAKSFFTLFQKDGWQKTAKERLGTFFDYKKSMVIKRAQKGKPVKWHFIISGLIFLTVSLVFIFLKPF